MEAVIENAPMRETDQDVRAQMDTNCIKMGVHV